MRTMRISIKCLKETRSIRDVVLARGGKPVARLVRIGGVPAERRFGAMRGCACTDDAFFEPLPETELAAWE